MMRFISSFLISGLIAISSIAAAAPQVDFVKKGVTVWKVGVPNSNVVGFKAQTIINHPINRVAMALADTDNSDEWLPRIGKIMTLRTDEGANLVDLHMVIDLPFPLSDRELYITSQAKRDAKGNLWISNDLMKNPPRANPDMVQITEYKGGWKLEQVGPNKTRVTLTGHADPAGAIPTFISNLFATQQPYEMMINLQKQSDKARYKDGEVTF